MTESNKPEMQSQLSDLCESKYVSRLSQHVTMSSLKLYASLLNRIT